MIPTTVLDADLARQVSHTYNTHLGHDVDNPEHQAALHAAAGIAFTAAQTIARQQAIAAFTAAYARSGSSFDPDITGEVLAEIADKAGGTFRQFMDAFHLGLPDPDFPLAALTDLLAITAAALAALGFKPTPVGTDIVAAMRREDVTTAAADDLRLHLLCEHGDLNALATPDRLAHLLHDHAHLGNTRHPAADRSWNELAAAAVIDDVPPDMGRASLHAALAAILQRLATVKS